MDSLTAIEVRDLRQVSRIGLLTSAMVIAITAPKGRFKEAVELVHFYSDGMPEEDIETAKTDSERQVFGKEDLCDHLAK
tara:strand:- start:405 stop:641 length:237 start_codon:yes stop_codon:yes gene_type:complete